MLVSAHCDLSPTWILDPRIASLIRYKARKLSRSAGFSRSDQTDIEQEFRVHLLDKAAKFDAQRSQLYTFSARVINNKARSLRRAGKQQRRDWRRQESIYDRTIDQRGKPIPLIETIVESHGRKHTGQRVLTAAELAQLRLDIDQANRELTPSLREMAAVLCHVNPFAAAEVIGISRRQAALNMITLRECYEKRGMNI